MPGLFSRGVNAIKELFSQSSTRVREERVIRYMLNEMQKGKSFDSVVNEAYVVNHTSPELRARMVENPRILNEIEDQLAGQHYHYTVDYATVKTADKTD